MGLYGSDFLAATLGGAVFFAGAFLAGDFFAGTFLAVAITSSSVVSRASRSFPAAAGDTEQVLAQVAEAMECCWRRAFRSSECDVTAER